MFKTELEKHLYMAAKAFIHSCELSESVKGAAQPTHPPVQNAIPNSTSNGVPVCSRHGKAMKLGQYGYHCTAKEADPRFANKNGYCNSKA